MKIATCIVSREGHDKPRCNPKWTDKRMRLLSKVLDKLKELQVDLVCLPGGYLIARSNSEKDRFYQERSQKT